MIDSTRGASAARPSKHVLMVAYYFPPVATSGSLRPLSFVRHLSANGWTPTVVAAEPRSIVPSLPVDEALGARVPPGVNVVRVAHGDPVQGLVRMRDTLRGRGQHGASTASSTQSGTPADARRPVWKRGLEALLDQAFAVPDRQCLWRGRALRAKIAHKPDLVYATGGPWTSLLVGEALARRFNVPFVADFRDPWTRNPARVMSPMTARRARGLERHVCHRATYIIANTQELREQFIDDYPEMADKFVTVTNGFDHDGAVQHPDSRSASPTRPTEIAHFGTVYGQRTPTALLQALDRLHAAGDVTSAALRLRFVGEWEVDDEACNAIARRLESAGLMVREPAVPHSACLAQMHRADVLLVLQSGFRLQIPTKIYEYVSTRRPVWLIGGEGATSALLGRHGLGLHSVDDVAAIEPILRKLASGETLAAPQPLDVEAFDYARLTRRLVHVFDDALAGPVFQPSLSPI